MAKAVQLGGRPMTKVRRQAIESHLYEHQRDIKTLQMLRLEEKHRQPIQALLMSGTGREVAHTLGMSESGVCRWRKRLDIAVDFGVGAHT